MLTVNSETADRDGREKKNATKARGATFQLPVDDDGATGVLGICLE
jgi:hypothetical protein